MVDTYMSVGTFPEGISDAANGEDGLAAMPKEADSALKTCP